MLKPRVVGVLASAAALVGVTTAASGLVPLRTVVVTGQQVSGLPTGVTFATLNLPDINAAGLTAFTATLEGSMVTMNNDQTLWSEQSGFLAQIAREGQQAPDLPMMVVFRSFNAPLLNDEGRLAFEAGLSGPGVDFSNDEGIWAQDATGLFRLFVREGAQANGAPAGINHSGIFSPVFNDEGRVGFSGNLAGSGVDNSNNEGIWTALPMNEFIVAREGNHATGLPPGVNFKFNTNVDPVLGDNGHVAFRANLIGAGVTPDNAGAVYSGPAGNISPVIRAGEPAPGTPAGVNLGGFFPPVINGNGDTMFQASLAGAGVDPTNDQGIFSEGHGSLALVAREGNPAPGAGAGVQFQSFFRPTMNAAGDTTFYAVLTGAGVDSTNNEGIWSEGAGALALVTREGDHAPGTPSGVTFAGDDVAMTAAFGVPVVNARGQMAFVARLTGPGVDQTNDEGIWGADPVAGLKLLVREGETIEVAPGDSRIITQLQFLTNSGGEDGKASGLNDHGQLVFRASFTDGSQGIFVTADTDGDGAADAFDNCPNNVNPNQEDADRDGLGDACDGCPNDPAKTAPGVCGCGSADTDTDGDGAADCLDSCPNDPNKLGPGVCGCGMTDQDLNGDGIIDCPSPPAGQTTTDVCGCGSGMDGMMVMPMTLLGIGWMRRRRAHIR